MTIICTQYTFYNLLLDTIYFFQNIISIYYIVFRDCFIWAFYIFYKLISDYFIFMTIILNKLMSFPTILYFIIALYTSLYFIKCYLELIIKLATVK